jgi:phosphonate transport system substrate-binding protein
MSGTVGFGLPPSVGRESALGRANLLQTYLSAALGEPVTVTVAANYKALKNDLLSGALIGAWGPPYICSRIEAYGGQALVRGVRGGRSSYRSALVGRQQRQIVLGASTQLRVAWVDPESVGGFLLPRALLRERHADGAGFLREERFVGSYRAGVQAVLDGDVDLAPVWAPDLESAEPLPALAELAGERAAMLEVLGVSRSCPNDGVVISPLAARAIAQGIQQLFLKMTQDAPGRAVLKEVFGAERFEAAPPGAYRAVNDLFADPKPATRH